MSLWSIRCVMDFLLKKVVGGIVAEQLKTF
jgi:hypothetical protein